MILLMILCLNFEAFPNVLLYLVVLWYCCWFWFYVIFICIVLSVLLKLILLLNLHLVSPEGTECLSLDASCGTLIMLLTYMMML